MPTIAERIELARIRYAKFDPNEPRDESGRWTDGGTEGMGDNETAAGSGLKEWFGNSVVTNSDGTPKVVYTGQPRRLEEAPDSVERNELPFGVMFLTDDRHVAAKYAGSHPDERQIRKRQSLEDYASGNDISDQHRAAAENIAGESLDDLSLEDTVSALRAAGVTERDTPIEVESEPRTQFSLGRRGKTYKCYLSIQKPFNLDEFNESDWRQAFLNTSGEEVPSGRDEQDDVIAGEMGLTRGFPEQDDDRGWYDRRSDYYSTDLDLEEFVKRRWDEDKIGTYLMGALNESPSGMASVMFPDAAKWLVEHNGYDGAIHTDTEVGGTTYIPFRPDQVKLASSKSFTTGDSRMAYARVKAAELRLSNGNS